MANRPESGTTLKVAASLAASQSGNLVGCHLRPHRATDRAYRPRGLSFLGGESGEWQEAMGEKCSESATELARGVFCDLVKEEGFRLAKKPGKSSGMTACWQEKVGSPDRLMAIMGPAADLSVVARPQGKGRVARMFVLAALLHSGRPVLLVPQAPGNMPGRRIAIGWNQSIEICRIISNCMPLLQQAEQVTLISSGREDRLGPKSTQMRQYLASWGVDAVAEVTPGEHEAKELLQAYKESGSDLLLMGAYSRPRFHQLVFGGMTEFMLWHARIPVLMQHF
jgi:nucleotide-binding universal stress UspA family protein